MSTKADRAALKRLIAWLESLDAFANDNDRLHEQLAVRIQRRIGRRNLRPEQVLRIVNAEFAQVNAARLELIESTIQRGVESGVSIPAEAAGAVLNTSSVVGVAIPTIASREASQVAGALMRQRLPFDQMTTAQRLARRTQTTARQVSQAIGTTLRTGQSARNVATEVVRAGDVRVDVPLYIERLDAAARSGDPGELRRTIRQEIARLRSSGSLAGQDISRDTRRFIRALERSEGADIDSALDEWIRRRAKNQAFTIARTEGVRAQHQAAIAAVQDREWAVGMRWMLSGAHPKMDICDMYAGRDEYGLGAGGYPKDAVPDLPHPNCTCYLAPIIDEQYDRRMLARQRGEPEPPRPWETRGGQNGRKWLEAQDEETQRAILGPGRYDEFQRRPTKVVQGNRIRPLYEVRGQPRPSRRTGERVTVRRGQQVDRVQRPAPLPMESPPNAQSAAPPSGPARARSQQARSTPRVATPPPEFRRAFAEHVDRLERGRSTDVGASTMRLVEEQASDRPATVGQVDRFRAAMAEHGVEVKRLESFRGGDTVGGDDAYVSVVNGVPTITCGPQTTPATLIRARGELAYANRHGYDTLGTFEARYAGVVHGDRYFRGANMPWRTRQRAMLRGLASEGADESLVERRHEITARFSRQLREERKKFEARYFKPAAIRSRVREHFAWGREQIDSVWWSAKDEPNPPPYLQATQAQRENQRLFSRLQATHPERDPLVDAVYVDSASYTGVNIPQQEQRIARSSGIMKTFRAQMDECGVAVSSRRFTGRMRGYDGYFDAEGGRRAGDLAVQRVARGRAAIAFNTDTRKGHTIETMFHERAHFLDWGFSWQALDRGTRPRNEGAVLTENITYAPFFSSDYWRFMKSYVTREARGLYYDGRLSETAVDGFFETYTERGIERLRKRGVDPSIIERLEREFARPPRPQATVTGGEE